MPVYAYLAGPDLFYPDYEETHAEKLALCEGFGLVGIPNAEFPGPVPPITSDRYIYEENVKLLDMADIVLANLRAFRGVEPDSGSVWECVYAFAKGKRVYAYYNHVDMCTAVQKMFPPLEWKDVEQPDGTTLAVPFDRDGVRVENWGKMLNLMLTNSFHYCTYGTFRDALTRAAGELGLPKK